MVRIARTAEPSDAMEDQTHLLSARPSSALDWCDDDESRRHDTSAAELAREGELRGAGFYASGYREGLESGKEAELQAGFDGGWAEGARAGWLWGQARGAAGALRAFAAAHPAEAELEGAAAARRRAWYVILSTPSTLATALARCAPSAECTSLPAA